jgi:hypothetical protein
MLDKLLNNILDVPHVEGLAIFNRSGNVLLKRMPSIFHDEIFGDLGRRIISMTETVDENFIPCDDYLLKYPGKWIMLRRTENIHLFLFCSEDVNVMSLKMVTNMAFKQLRPEMLPPPAATPTPPATPAAVPASATTGPSGNYGKPAPETNLKPAAAVASTPPTIVNKWQRVYRGRVL